MAAQSGKDLLLKVDTTGAGGFQTVAGLRATRLVYEYLGRSALEALPAARSRGFCGLDDLPPEFKKIFGLM